MYELSHELTNDLRLRILGIGSQESQEIMKFQNNDKASWNYNLKSVHIALHQVKLEFFLNILSVTVVCRHSALLSIYISYKLYNANTGECQEQAISTSIFFESKANDKSILKPTKRQREDPNSQVSVVNYGTFSSSSQETFQIPTNDFRYK